MLFICVATLPWEMDLGSFRYAHVSKNHRVAAMCNTFEGCLHDVVMGYSVSVMGAPLGVLWGSGPPPAGLGPQTLPKPIVSLMKSSGPPKPRFRTFLGVLWGSGPPPASLGPQTAPKPIVFSMKSSGLPKPGFRTPSGGALGLRAASGRFGAPNPSKTYRFLKEIHRGSRTPF